MGAYTIAVQHLQTDAYAFAFDQLQRQEAAQKSKTQEMEELFVGLVPAARNRDLQIQMKYAAKGSAEYTLLLPRGRAPFYTDARDMRVRAISQLSMGVENITVLAAVKAETSDMYTALSAAIAAQADAVSLTEIKRRALEDARIVACEGLEDVLTGLKQMFPNNLKRVDEFFPLDLIRTIRQKVFTGTLIPSEVKNFAKRTLKPTTMVRLRNAGSEPLAFYLALTKSGAVPDGTIPVIVLGGTSATVAATALGNLKNTYMFVRNTSDRYDWEYEVEI